MWRRRLPTAIFIDFDNIVGRVGKDFVDRIDAWTAWIEDGRHAGGKRPARRRIVEKRVYWNAPNEGFRAAFERRGYEAFSCPSRVDGKRSAADMVIALHAFELTYTRPQVEEFVVFTTDTDFVELLVKLTERNKRTVAFANEKDVSFTVYSDFADHVISLGRLKDEAYAYVSPPSFWERMRAARPARPAPAAKAGPSRPAPARPSPGARSGPRTGADLLPDAVAVVESLARSMPGGRRLGKDTVNKALRNRLGAGYRTSHPGAYLGFGAYDKMARALEQRCAAVALRKEQDGGIVLVTRGPVAAE